MKKKISAISDTLFGLTTEKPIKL